MFVFSFTAHMTTHTGDKKFKCTLCTESFIKKLSLLRHMKFHGLPGISFLCDTCGVQFTTREAIKRHIDVIHNRVNEVPKFKCRICNNLFLCRKELIAHRKTSHEPLPCETCSMSFMNIRKLKIHQKTHIEGASIPRVKCQICHHLLADTHIRLHVFKKHPEKFEAWQRMNVPTWTSG